MMKVLSPLGSSPLSKAWTSATQPFLKLPLVSTPLNMPSEEAN
jgi:hypothetical protein